MNLRDYTKAPVRVRECYRKMRANQTLDRVIQLENKYNVPEGLHMTVWDALHVLDNFVDLSDPDMDLPNSIHMLQTAEGARLAGEPDWLQLTGLIHDLGKCIYLRGTDEDGTSLQEQWSIVGDTFVVGDPLPQELVHPEFNQLNPDSKRSIYERGCGLDNCHISYGHDEYLYQVLKRSKNTLPEPALYMIRYHSLYPWHRDGCYKHLENNKDREMKEWVQRFNKYDLYTKENTRYTGKRLQDLKSYYSTLIDKYFQGPLIL